MEMNLDYAEGLAVGYAWGQTDKPEGTITGTMDGITFGKVYRAHAAREQSGQTCIRWSVQHAYQAWQNGEQLP